MTDVAPSKNAVYDEVELINYEGIRKNYIVNGNFDLWNLGTSQTTSGLGSADAWQCLHANTSAKTASRQTFTLGQTDVPGEPAWFMRHEITTSSNAAEYAILAQYITNARMLSGKTVTLSFYAKADANKNIAVEFYQSFGTGGSPSASVTGIGAQKIAITTSWARYTVTVAIPSVSGKTLGTDNNSSIRPYIWFTCGSDRAARTDSLGNQSGTFDIANVALVEGADISPLVKSVNEEQGLCSVDDTAYGAGWDGVTGVAPSKNAVYDQMILQMLKNGSNLAIGSDANGDMYYRASNVLARLAKGTANLGLFMNAEATAPEWANGVKYGTFTRVLSVGSGDVSYTGVGFKPSALILISVLASTSISVGFGTTDGLIYVKYVTGTGSVGSTTYIINVGNAAGDVNYAIIKSFDADGFTLTWTKVGSPTSTATVSYLAFR